MLTNLSLQFLPFLKFHWPKSPFTLRLHNFTHLSLKFWPRMARNQRSMWLINCYIISSDIQSHQDFRWKKNVFFLLSCCCSVQREGSVSVSLKADCRWGGWLSVGRLTVGGEADTRWGGWLSVGYQQGRKRRAIKSPLTVSAVPRGGSEQGQFLGALCSWQHHAVLPPGCGARVTPIMHCFSVPLLLRWPGAASASGEAG